MNSRSAERKRRLLILRNQRARAPEAPEIYPRPGEDDFGEDDLIEEFRAACGVGGLPRLSIGRADHSARDCFVLEKPYAVLGQSAECDIRLAGDGVSYRHAYLQLVNGRLLCIDLASGKGIYFGAKPVHAAWLDAGGTASIGPYRLHYLGDQRDVFNEVASGRQTPCDERSTPSRSGLLPPDQPALLPKVSLVFLNARTESSGQRQRRIKRMVTLLGASRACKLHLVDGTVSRVHCSFVLTPRGLWVVDLLGRGGTMVNGDIIQHGRLDDGAEICVGRFRFGVRYETDESTPPWTIPAQPLSSLLSSANETAPKASSIVSGESAIVMADETSAIGPPPSELDISSATRVDSGSNVSLAEPETKRPAITAADEDDPSGRFSEKFVRSLVEQFTVMQQQMFDQTQQQMAMLTQVFSEMYQSQQDLIRDELQRIHTLTAEIQDIQSRVLAHQLTADNEELPAAHRPNVLQNKGLTADIDLPLSDSGDHPARDQMQDDTPAAAMTVEPLPDEPETVPPTNVADTSATADLPADEGSGVVRNPPRSRTDIDSHARLTERIGQLECERSSHWKRVMQALSGGRSSPRT